MFYAHLSPFRCFITREHVHHQTNACNVTPIASVHSMHQHPSVMLLVQCPSIVHLISHVIVQLGYQNSYCSACPLESRIEGTSVNITEGHKGQLLQHFISIALFHTRIVHAHVLCACHGGQL